MKKLLLIVFISFSTACFACNEKKFFCNAQAAEQRTVYFLLLSIKRHMTRMSLGKVNNDIEKLLDKGFQGNDKQRFFDARRLYTQKKELQKKMNTLECILKNNF